MREIQETLSSYRLGPELDIESPGKFEGEWIGTAFAWSYCDLDPIDRSDGSTLWTTTLEPEEMQELYGRPSDYWDENLDDERTMVAEESECGFVTAEWISPDDLEARIHKEETRPVNVLCGCGWGRLSCPVDELPVSCPVCSYVFVEED